MLGRRKDTVIRGFRLFDGIARLARDLKSYLWVADPRQVPFLCSCKEKEPKESTPRSRRILLALLAGIGARLNSPGAKYAPRAQTRGSLLPIPAAMLGGGYGDQKKPVVPFTDMNIGKVFC